MLYPLVPFSDRVCPWNYWDDQFTTAELDRLETIARTAADDAVAGGRINSQLRRSKVKWIAPGGEHLWLFEKLARIVSISNAQHYRFDLTGFGEALQFTRYEGSDQGEYGWHQDYGMEVSRKLSLAMQLSDPDDYKGGRLQLMFGNEPVEVVKKRGMIAIFPSHTLHRVTAVTQGARHSLVAWISGPPFR